VRPARQLVVSLVANAAAAATLVAPGAPAVAAPPSYVALGDSYSSGVGTRSYIDDGTACRRSTYAYPSLIAAARGYALTFRACSGARVADVTNTQLSALGSTTAYVTISVGGNDAGFADVLDSTIATAASAKGFAFADPVSRFVGHAVCDDVEWLNGLSSPVSESYHPDRAGHARGYTPLVSPLLTGSTVAVSGATLRTAAASADRLAAAAAPYAAQDATIRPERFEVPDLTSQRAREAARRAGIDLDRWLARRR